MTDSENSQPQDDSDEDIYKDIPEFNFEDELAKLEGSKENYKQEASDLSDKVKILTEENKELKKANEVLKRNLSTLLKTAQAEVQRKDSMIDELRTQVDSFTFRRNRNSTKDKYTSTDDLKFTTEVKCEPEKHKAANDKNRLSYDNRTSSDSELRFNREEKKKESSTGKERNSDCDGDRKSGKHSNSRRSESSHNRHREKKSSRYEDSPEYRRSYQRSHRSHLKSDSYDKKRHSRSSDSRFLSRRRHSRERKTDRRRSSERRRSEESSERSRRRKNKSRSRELSRGSKEPSIEKPKSRSSRDKDSGVSIKEQISNKSEISNGGVRGTGGTGNRNSEKHPIQEDSGKNKQIKEKRSLKEEKLVLDIFNTKSPLDALYSEMVTSRSSNRFVPRKSGTTDPDSGEEDEVPVAQKREECSEPLETHPNEDWALSFKNERQNDTKPMTLYSRRMLRKFSSELKTKETNKREDKEEPKQPEVKSSGKIEDEEKEPGELTDDENVVESSKEFQELAKVASIEIVEQPVKEMIFKDPIRRDSSKGETPEELERPIPQREDPIVSKETEQNKESREVIEFSPFKNNYKLIEISPIKPPNSEHVLDFYNQRAPLKEPLDSSGNLTESEKSTSKPSDTSEEKTSETELKIVLPPAIASPKEKKSNNKEDKEPRRKKDKTEEKKPKEKKQDSKSKRKPEKKPMNDEKNQKRKRKSSETDEGSNSKKRKLDKREDISQRKSRSKRNSKTEPEIQPEPESEEKMKDDISTFEFFKPVAKPEVPQTPIDSVKSASTTTDYKMTATMSVTGVVRLETPNKCVDKLKNLMINEHMIFNVLDSKNNSQFSPLIGSKLIEMTPRRMLKNDLMLTDSEDDSVCKRNTEEGGVEEAEGEEEEDEFSGSENSDCDSDSGASDFVDLL